MAPRLFERGLTGLFRSRWGVALVIGVLVLAVVGLGRLFSDGGRDTDSSLPPTAGSPAPIVSVDPDQEDSVISPEPPPAPTAKPGTAKPDEVAYTFASAWVNHDGVSAKAWRDKLTPNATKDLSDELADTDPRDVPASRVIGSPELKAVGEGLANAVIRTDAGTLTLSLAAPDGRWLVSGIDWEEP